jgi:hypothetical protein
MRKRHIEPARLDSPIQDEKWLDLEALAEVEFTSEDPANPIEQALLPGHSRGWLASAPGEQSIRLVFADPQDLKRVRLHFVEDRHERTQEYVLRWSPDGGKSLREIVRQQWTFSPHGATTEVEIHAVELSAVTVLELTIIPDIGGSSVKASLQEFRVA